MRGKKRGIIITIIFLIIVILAGISTYLFMATDIFKGKKQLFFKYLTKTLEQTEEVANSKILENYKKEINAEICETNTTIDFKYSEGGEVSSGYNNLNINMKTQKENQYNYKNAQVLFGDRSIVQVEGIQADSLYGIRFTNIFNQFVTLQDGKNIEGLNLTDESLNTIKYIIEDNKDFYNGILFTKQDYQNLKTKYMQIIAEALNEGTFIKQNNSIITIDSQTAKTTAYFCQLNGFQVQNLVLKLLNELENDDIILNKVDNMLGDTKKYENSINEILRDAEDTEFADMKIAIYEQKGNVVRTAVNIGTHSFVIENSNNSENYLLKMQHILNNSEKENSQQIEISKVSTDLKEEYVVNIETIDGDDKYLVDIKLESDYQTTNFNLDFYKGIVNINVKAKTTIENTINQKVELGTKNNVILNNLNEDLFNVVVDKMKSAYTDILVKRYSLLVKKLKSEDLMSALKSILSEENFDEDDQTNEPTIPSENQITKEEINRFNAKFEFYSGTDISGESVKVLLDVVKDNLESVNITPINTESTSSDEIEENIKLNIKKDTENIDLANGIIERIDSQEKYNVTTNYNETTGILESIEIEPSRK